MLLPTPAWRGCDATGALEHDPEKACPGLDPGWLPVFRKDHGQTKNRFFDFAHVLIGKPVPTFPEHALGKVALVSIATSS